MLFNAYVVSATTRPAGTPRNPPGSGHQPRWQRQGSPEVCPLFEDIHQDATLPAGGAALFGFFRLPSQVRGRASDRVLKEHCRAQLARLFDPEAAAPCCAG